MNRLTALIGRQPLAVQIGALIAATALPLILAFSLVFVQLVLNEQGRAREALLLRTRTLAALVDNEIETFAAIGWALANSRSLETDDLASFQKEAAKAVLFVPGGWLTLSRPDGQVVVSTLEPLDSVMPMHPEPERVAAALASGKPQVSDLVLGPISKRLNPYVEVPAFRGGAAHYSLAVAMPPERFLALMQSKTSAGEVVGLVDRNRRFIARIPDHERRLGRPASDDWRSAMAGSAEGWFEGMTLEGALTLTAYAPTSHGWTVGIGVPVTQLTEPTRRLFWETAVVAVGLLGLGAFLASLLALRITRGMNALALTAAKVGAGEAVAAPAAPFAEAHAIGAALARASEELKRRGDLIARDKEALEAQVAARTRDLVREMEQKAKVEDQLLQSQKMEALGRLAGGIAHDFNNMLAVIVSSLELLQRRAARGQGDLAPLVDAALKGAHRATGLTRRLLTFSRQQPLAPVVADINEIVRDMGLLLERTLGDRIRLDMDLNRGLWPIRIDPTQFEQAMVNLAANARDAMSSGGRFAVSTRNATAGASEPDGPAAAGVAVTASDTGCGMEPDIAARAAEPFFTTKAVGRGTGLGLSQVDGFVRQSGGRMRIDASPGRGATVELWFPRYDEALEAGAERGANAAEAGRARPGETVLVVDDEAEVRAMVVGELRELGYDTLEANGAEEALQARGTFHLLLTDVVMPGMSGRNLAEIVTARRPETCVLFMSGHAPGGILDERPGGDLNLLRKPFTIEELASAVRRTLNGIAG